MQDFQYIHTLGFFLEHSDEDIVDSEAIFQFLNDQGFDWCSEDGPARWLDVGSGPATKVIAVLKHWQALGRKDLPNVSFVEPSAEWVNEATLSFEHAGMRRLLGENFPITWEEFVSGLCGRFRLISFLHSVYGLQLGRWGRLESFVHLPALLDNRGWVCIAIESPTSDLYVIKKRLFPALKFQLVDYGVVAQTFCEFGWNYIVNDDLQQKFYLAKHPTSREDAMGNIVALSFVAQTTPDSYQGQLSPKEIEALTEVVNEVLKEDTLGWYLDVPDRIYWTQCKSRRASIS